MHTLYCMAFYGKICLQSNFPQIRLDIHRNLYRVAITPKNPKYLWSRYTFFVVYFLILSGTYRNHNIILDRQKLVQIERRNKWNVTLIHYNNIGFRLNMCVLLESIHCFVLVITSSNNVLKRSLVPSLFLYAQVKAI